MSCLLGPVAGHTAVHVKHDAGTRCAANLLMEERQKRRRVGLACCSSPAAPPRHAARRAGAALAARPAPGAVPGTTSEEDEGDGYHTAEEDFGPDGPRARSGCALLFLATVK